MSTEQPTRRPNKVHTLIWIGIVAALLVMVGIFAAANLNSEPEASPGSTSEAIQLDSLPTPNNVTEDGGVFVTGVQTKEGAPVVAVYVDFICPACKKFDEVNGALLEDMAAKGEISLEYRPIAILDRASTSEYSSRALNAFSCVADSSPENAVALINKLMEEQPHEGTAGLTNEELAALVTAVGSEEAATCVTDEKFIGWSEKTTEVALERGLTHTPFVVVDDVLWDGKGNLVTLLTEGNGSSL